MKVTLCFLFSSLLALSSWAQEAQIVATGQANWARGPIANIRFKSNTVAFVQPSLNGLDTKVVDLATGEISEFIKNFTGSRTPPVPQIGPSGQRYLAYRNGREFRILRASKEGNGIDDIPLDVAVMDLDVDSTGTIYVIGPSGNRSGIVHAFGPDGKLLWSAVFPTEIGVGSSGKVGTWGLRSWYHVLAKGNGIYAIAKDAWAIFDPEGKVLAHGRFQLSSPNAGVGIVDYVPDTGWLIVEAAFPGGPGVFAQPHERLFLHDKAGRRIVEIRIPKGASILAIHDGKLLLMLQNGQWAIAEIRK